MRTERIGYKSKAQQLLGLFYYKEINKKISIKVKIPFSPKENITSCRKKIMTRITKGSLEKFPIAMYESTPDLERGLVFCNQYTKDFLGIKKEEIIYLNKFVASEDKVLVEEELALMLRIKKPVEIKYKVHTNNHEEIWVLDKICPMFDEQGQVVSFHGVIEDITLSQKAELIMHDYNEALKKGIEEKTFQLTILNSELKKTNNLKDKFFSIIAHDLRSPFSALIDYTKILIRDVHKSDRNDIEKSLKLINSSSKNVYTLMENLLTWSQLQTNTIQMHREVILLDKLIESIVSPLKVNIHLKEIEALVNIEDEAQAFADERSVRTAIYNILTNAIKFTPIGGEISINISALGSYTFIEIKDSGIGIPKEHIDNIFCLSTKESRFGTQGERGSGLGLVLTKEFIEKNEGKINIASEENKGTIITLSLPTKRKIESAA